MIDRPVGLRLVVTPRRVLGVTLGVSIFLVAVGTVAGLLIRTGPSADVQSVLRLLMLDDELTIPAWWTSALHAAGGTVAHVTAGRLGTGATARRLRVVGVAMFAMSLDELLVIHELGDEAMRRVAGTGSTAALWVIPAGILAAAVAASVLPLLRDVSPAARNLVLVGGALFLLGAVAVEVVARPLYAPPTEASVGFVLLVTLEEALEMFGVGVALAGLLIAAGDLVPAHE